MNRAEQMIHELESVRRLIFTLNAPTPEHTKLLNSAYDRLSEAIAFLERVNQLGDEEDSASEVSNPGFETHQQ